MSARALALRVLERRFASARCPSQLPGLAEFQQEAHATLLDMLERYGGGLLADSVGLGKTHVAAAVARSVRSSGAPLAVVPTSLARTWRKALRALPDASVLTHATLSRGGGKQVSGSGLVIVDEAHAFRNPRTHRYAALARLVEQRPVLLLTATPVNNSVWDLYWLLRLFLRDDAFAELGVNDLAECCERVHRTGRSGRLPTVLAAVTVRRSRTTITEQTGGAPIRVGGIELAFPHRDRPQAVRYDLPAILRPVLHDTIEALELTPWHQTAANLGVCLLRLTLLKRLESSVAALRASLLRVRATTEAFAEALDRGRLLAPVDRPASRNHDPDQLSLDALTLRALPAHIDGEALRRSAARDLVRLQAALSRVALAPQQDSKLAALRRLLGRLGDRPALLFTEFRDTAEYLWQALRDQRQCALIHGSSAWLGRTPASRRVVVERFAPRANGVPPPAARERVALLIATDVLAEGLNLQDTADVISYDLPWNPIRLVQRLGRIDRLGSPHSRVRSWYFAPERELEQLLGLLRRLRSKLRAIRTTIGAEAPVLAPTASTTELRALAHGSSAAVFAAARRQSGWFDIEARLRAAWTRATRDSGDPLSGLPLAEGGAGVREKRVARDAADCAAAAASAAPAGGATPDLAARLRAPASLLPRCGHAHRPAALVCLTRGPKHRSVFVSSRGCFEEEVLAGELILLALEQPLGSTELPPGMEVQHFVRAAQRWLSRPAAPSRRRRAALLIRDRLLRLLEDQPGGLAAAECSRVEAILGALSRPLTLTSQLALAPLLHDPTARSLPALLRQLEALLGGRQPTSPGTARPSPPRSDAGYAATAVFFLDWDG